MHYKQSRKIINAMQTNVWKSCEPRLRIIVEMQFVFVVRGEGMQLYSPIENPFEVLGKV